MNLYHHYLGKLSTFIPLLALDKRNK